MSWFGNKGSSNHESDPIQEQVVEAAEKNLIRDIEILLGRVPADSEIQDKCTEIVTPDHRIHYFWDGSWLFTLYVHFKPPGKPRVVVDRNSGPPDFSKYGL